MDTTEPIGRNDPCPCGSGQKYKLCCEGRQDIVQETKKSPWLMGGAAVLGLGVVATVAMQLGDAKPSAVNNSPARPPAQSPMVDPAALLAPLVPGEGGPQNPPGKVWSAEHGHYHDLAGNELPSSEGGAQPGKVWSAEHGHYHDLAGNELPATPAPVGATPISPTPAAAGTLTPQPDGPVPEGKVWSPEHGHWHDIGTATGEPAAAGAMTPQPDGPVPEGKVWSPEHGHWHDAPGATPSPMPEIKIGEVGGGEIVPIPPPAGAGSNPPAPAPTPAPTPPEQTPPK